MTRYKKELKKRGFKFDEDYEYLPIPYKKGSNIYIETTFCKIIDNYIMVRMITNVIDDAVFFNNRFEEVFTKCY